MRPPRIATFCFVKVLLPLLGAISLLGCASDPPPPRLASGPYTGTNYYDVYADTLFQTVYHDWLSSQVTNANRVEVSLLGEMHDVSKPDEFPVVPYRASAAILAQKSITGPDAQAVVARWTKLLPGDGGSCHFPKYGLRFFANDKLLLQTSVCWSCRNFYIAQRWVGFNAKSDSGKMLFEKLNEIVPPRTK
ncbi:MAG TPA: hypothetical protein VGK40_00210 [Verrucomicrobiae bacterium]|jgi:hypothetical protein